MTNIQKFPGAPDHQCEPVQNSIDLLEELLAKAKSGELRSVAVAYTEEGDGVHSCWSNNHELYKLAGVVGQLLHNLYAED
jgi:hypothetical protein